MSTFSAVVLGLSFVACMVLAGCSKKPADQPNEVPQTKSPGLPVPDPRPAEKPIATTADALHAEFKANATATAVGGDADIKFLQAEVRSVGFTGAPGGVAVFGEKAFPVVTDESPGAVPVVASARLGKGRVTYFGHEAFLIVPPTGDTARFLQNVLLWTAGAEQGREKVTVLTRGMSALPKFLPAERFAVSEFKDKDGPPANVARSVIVISNTGSVSAEQAKSLKKYVEDGGGLVFGVPGWGWQQLNPGKKLATDYPLADVLQAAGLALTDSGIRSGKGNTLQVKVPPRFAHSGEAVRETARLRKEGSAPPRGPGRDTPRGDRPAQVRR